MGGANRGGGDGIESGAPGASRRDIGAPGSVSASTSGSEGGPEAEAAKRLAHTHPTVVVLGELVLQVWRRGRGDRLSREAAVPVVEVEHTENAPGGVANTAVRLAALGARVRLVGLAGDDAAAAILRAELERAGVDTGRLHTRPDRTTATTSRITAGDRILLRYDEGHPALPDTAETAILLDLLEDALAGADALLVEEHDGILAEGPWARLATGRERPPLLIVDTHHPDQQFEGTDSRVLVVRPDRDGTRAAHRTWTQPVPNGGGSGTGDTFVAALTLALVDGMPPPSAVELAWTAEAGARRPDRAAHGPARSAELCDRGGGAVLDPPRLHAAVRRHRASGARIVFTNGCFDVLHAGHIAYLDEARRLGDVLIVAVNSDAGVRRLKGSDRPVNPAQDRCAVLAALSCVDHVTIFDADTPVELLRDIQPDLYVKGGDYRPDMLPETPVVHGYGGEVRILEYLDDHSTSATIERIRAGVAAGTHPDPSESTHP